MLAESRRAIRAAVGEPAAATFLRWPGNLGDDLLRAGTRRLLSTLPIGRLTEIGLRDLERSSGDVLLVCGGGGWCAPFHTLVPPLLPALCRRFGRVVVLPSTYDPAVPAVRRALGESQGAVFFARELVSYERIEGLCERRLALDGAHFFDFEPYRRPGTGTLLAYRTDAERHPGADLPPGNRDVAAESSDLDEFLWAIARAAEVRTDRAHVVIAGALLGKRVRYRSSSYFKVPAIASFGLAEFDVAPDADSLAMSAPLVQEARHGAPGHTTDPPGLDGLRRRLADFAAPAPAVAKTDAAGRPRLSVVMLISERPREASRAVRSLAAISLPLELVLVDHTTSPAARAAVERAAADIGLAPTVLRPDRDLGVARGRALAMSAVSTELALILDDDAEIVAGSVERLIERLDRDPSAIAATPSVVLPSGAVQICGGRFSIEDDFVVFSASADGLGFDEPAVGEAAPCGWVPGGCTLVRRQAFERHPLDPGMEHYFEDNEWCYRLAAAGEGRFWREPRAVILHHLEPRARLDSPAAEAVRLAPFLRSILHFRHRHGKILFNLFYLMPELWERRRPRLAAARLLIDLGMAYGVDGLLERWLAGGLEPLLAPPVPPGPNASPAVERTASPPSELRALQLRAEFDRGQAEALSLFAGHAVLVAALESERAATRDALERAGIARRELEALHSSRWYRLADRYWRLRRRWIRQ